MWLGALPTPLEAFKARRALRAARRAADAELLRRETPPLRLAWRAEELVTPKNRLELAHTLRSLVRDAGARYLPSASPVNRLAVRAEAETLLAMPAASPISSGRSPRAASSSWSACSWTASGPLYDRERARRTSRLPRHGARRTGAALMVELLGIVIAVSASSLRSP